MRLSLPGVFAAAACLLPLAGCGQAEQAVRAQYRDTAVSACANQMGRMASGPLANVDVPAFCGCVVDRFMEGKSLADLRTAPRPEDVDPNDLAQCAAQSATGGAQRGTKLG